MKALMSMVLVLALGAQLHAQDHYYQIFSIGACNHEELAVSLTPMFEPTPNILVLEMEPFQENVYEYHLFNMHGVAMRSGKVAYNETEIIMKDYPVGNYHLLINTTEEDVQLFWIKKRVME